MRFDEKDTYLLPIDECPETCGECKYYDGKNKYAYCRANNQTTATFSWKSPKGSVISAVPPCCPWWYVAAGESEAERTARFLWLVGARTTRDMTRERRQEWMEHITAVGGIENADKEKFPELAEAADEVRERMGLRRKNGRAQA